MRLRIWFVGLIGGLLWIAASMAYAHPPTDIQMEFDKVSQTLHLKMQHVSSDFYDHYIRKTVVYVNGQEAATVANHRQINPSEFKQDISVQAKVGDEITVKIYCAEGGVGSAAMTVTEEEKDEEKK